MAKFTYSSKTSLPIEDQSTTHGTLEAYGFTGPVKGASVTIDGFTHWYPNDVDMLLVAPDGQHNFAFMSDTGGDSPYAGWTFSFSDDAVNHMTDIDEGTYLPTDNGTAEGALNWGLGLATINHPSSATFASSFGGIDGNGVWSLYVRDDANNDSGNISRWKVTLETDESTVDLKGTDGDDIIKVLSTGSQGAFEINDRGTVDYTGVYWFLVDAGGGNDLLVLDDEGGVFIGGAGRDTIHSGGGNDYLKVVDGDDVGEVYDGGVGDDELAHYGYGTLNLRDDTLVSIEKVRLYDGGKVMLDAAQVSGLKYVTGGGDITHPDELAVRMGSKANLDLGAISIQLFNHAGDVVTVKGDNDSETILGSDVNDIIKAAGGTDRIVTNLGRDTVDGGKGADAIDYSTRNVSIKVTLNGSSAVNVSVDGVVEDSIRNIEDVLGGSAADILKGDKLANTLFGLAGTDKLKGFAGNDEISGGLGADTVWGGAGEDAFIFSTPLDAIDHIKDFSHADDTIVLDNAVFAAFAKTGLIKANKFIANASGHDAHTAKQKLIYDKADHSLWYDADGSGVGAAVEIAIFDNKIKNLDYNDFLIV